MPNVLFCRVMSECESTAEWKRTERGREKIASTASGARGGKKAAWLSDWSHHVPIFTHRFSSRLPFDWVRLAGGWPSRTLSSFSDQRRRLRLSVSQPNRVATKHFALRIFICVYFSSSAAEIDAAGGGDATPGGGRREIRKFSKKTKKRRKSNYNQWNE